MPRQLIVESVLYEVLFQQRGIVKTFSEALRHNAGEPVDFYGAEIPALAAKILEALDAR